MSVDFYTQDVKDTWQTPDEIINALSNHITISLDPCAGLFTFIGEENWTIDVPETIPSDCTSIDSSSKIYDVNVYDSDGTVLRCGGDSLSRSWDTGGIAFVNPPFSMKDEFIDKTLEEIASGNIDGAILVTPDNTDVKSWWHGKLVPEVDIVWFSEGRVSFIDPDSGEPVPNPTNGTAMHFIGPRDLWPNSLFDELDTIGDVVVRWRAT